MRKRRDAYPRVPLWKPGVKGMFLIRHEDGSYFAEWDSGLIGPRFGANQKTAMRFHTYQKAAELSSMHYAFENSKIITVDSVTTEAVW